MRKRRKKSQSPLVAEYRKQRKRVQAFVRRARKRGFEVSDDIVPKIPKRITSGSVNRLKKLTPEALYKKLIYVSRETGEIFSGNRARKAQKEESKKEKNLPSIETLTTPASTQIKDAPQGNYDTLYEDVIISQFLEIIDRANEVAKNILQSWLNKVIADNGKHDVAVVLERAAQLGRMIEWRDLYDTDTLITKLSSFLDYLPEHYQQGFAIDEMQDFLQEIWNG